MNINFTATIVGAGIAGVVAFSAYLLVIRLWILTWGATGVEVHRSLPGDDLVPRPRMKITHAITIRASATKVWPWLVQIGYRRAGWYSYDFIHRALGVAGSVDDDHHSASRIIPELQQLEVGDSVEIAPEMGYTVAAIEPGRALVLHTSTDMSTWRPFDPTDTMPDKYLNSSWAWFLDEVDERTTRLIVRIQQDYNPSLLNALMMRGLIEPGSFVMERKTLLGIKQRAEAAAEQHRGHGEVSLVSKAR